VRGVPRHRRPLAPLPVILQVHLPEGWLPHGDDRRANLQTKQGRGDDYIPVMLTSSYSG
jgi:hypothetical protein